MSAHITEMRPALSQFRALSTTNPEAYSFLISAENWKDGETRVMVFNMTSEDVILEFKDNPGVTRVAKSQKVSIIKHPSGTTVSITGKDTGTKYETEFWIDQDQTKIFVQDAEAVKTTFVNGRSMPWLVFAIVSLCLLIISIVIYSRNHGKVRRACSVGVQQLLNPNAELPFTPEPEFLHASEDVKSNLISSLQERCERGGGLKVSFAVVLVPFLVLAGTIAGYILLASPWRIRASPKDCVLRDPKVQSWTPGYKQKSGFFNRALCRVLGVCDCMNPSEEYSCMVEGFVQAKGKVSELIYMEPVHNHIDDENAKEAIRVARAIAKVERSREFMLAEGYLMSDDPAPPAEDIVTEDIVRTFEFNQKVANRFKGWQCPCCPTKDAPPESVCMNCAASLSGVCISDKDVCSGKSKKDVPTMRALEPPMELPAKDDEAFVVTNAAWRKALDMHATHRTFQRQFEQSFLREKSH